MLPSVNNSRKKKEKVTTTQFEFLDCCLAPKYLSYFATCILELIWGEFTLYLQAQVPHNTLLLLVSKFSDSQPLSLIYSCSVNCYHCFVSDETKETKDETQISHDYPLCSRGKSGLSEDKECKNCVNFTVYHDRDLRLKCPRCR